MLCAARGRCLNPDYTVFDSRYTSQDNLRQPREMGWNWFARMKENRLVVTDPRGSEFEAISDIKIPQQGRAVIVKDYGPVKVFRTVREEGEPQYWATDNFLTDAKKKDELESMGWGIEVYHRDIESGRELDWGLDVPGNRLS